MDDYIKQNFSYKKGTKEYFQVSLCKDGILGGCIIINEDVMTYRSEKITIADEYKSLDMKYKDILELDIEESLLWSYVSVKMNNGKKYKFLMYDVNEFISVMRKKGVKSNSF